jgi:Nucleolar protein 12 (25kDa)
MAKIQRKKKGTELVWDRSKRIDFVTGFKKRKDERREVAKLKIKEE